MIPAPMATVGERLATLAAELADLRKDVDDLHDEIHGGRNMRRDDSLRGRMHKLEGTIGALVLRRSFGIGMFRGWVQVVLALVAVGTLAAAWYGALHH